MMVLELFKTLYTVSPRSATIIRATEDNETAAGTATAHTARVLIDSLQRLYELH